MAGKSEQLFDYMFALVEAVLLLPDLKNEASPHSNFYRIESNRFQGVPAVYVMHLPRPNPY